MLTFALPLSAASLVVFESARRHGSARTIFIAAILGFLLVPGLVLQLRALAFAPASVRALAAGVNAWGMVAFVATFGAMIVAPRLRPAPWVALVAVPGTVWAAGTLLAIPYVALSAALGALLGAEGPPVAWLFYAVAATGVWTSFVPRREVVRFTLGERMGDTAARATVARRRVAALPAPLPGGPLRLAQITDPHLGPFRSEDSLRRLCERAVAADPDLILLTGDFLTIEGAGDPDALVRALGPLRALTGRTFACLGNHDHEHPHTVRAALEAAGVSLLVDEAAVVATRRGAVQIIGLEHRWSGREAHAALLRRVVRVEGALRLVLLHDPGAFRHLPHGEADLVLSGHTHGGHVGLVSLGLDWTAVYALAGIPDHGLWGRGTDRLYVHRGSGHYGFPLRIGVPLEESIIEVDRS